MSKFTKKDLKSGLFGKCNGDLFVVAGDKLVYENGLYDDFDDMNDNLEFGFGCNVDELYEALCFNQIKDNAAELIWKRGDETPETPDAPEVHEPTPESTPEPTPNVKSITINEEQFFEAVKKADGIFQAIPGGEGNELANLMMGIQNMAFGALIAQVLFDK